MSGWRWSLPPSIHTCSRRSVASLSHHSAKLSAPQTTLCATCVKGLHRLHAVACDAILYITACCETTTCLGGEELRNRTPHCNCKPHISSFKTYTKCCFFSSSLIFRLVPYSVRPATNQHLFLTTKAIISCNSLTYVYMDYVSCFPYYRHLHMCNLLFFVVSRAKHSL